MKLMPLTFVVLLALAACTQSPSPPANPTPLNEGSTAAAPEATDFMSELPLVVVHKNEIVAAKIYKERVAKRGYGSGAWGWQTAYRETIAT